jgi:hypothetical protein
VPHGRVNQPINAAYATIGDASVIVRAVVAAPAFV